MARSNSTDSKASQLDEARELAKAGVELTAQDDRLFTTLAEIELAAGDRSAAKEWLRQGCETIEGQSSLAVNLPRMRLDDGETTAARQTIGVTATRGISASLNRLPRSASRMCRRQLATGDSAVVQGELAGG